MNQKKLLNLIVCGLAGTTASLAVAGTSTVTERPVTVNISGATLMENFVRGFASTNDFLDLDRDGRVVNATTDENLSATLPAAVYDSDLWMIVQYRVTGSVNGFQELLDFGVTPLDHADLGSPTAGVTIPNTTTMMSSDVASLAFANGTPGQYIANGQPGGVASTLFNTQHPGGVPTKAYNNADMPPAGKSVHSATPYIGGNVRNLGGYRQDLAPLDVPTNWAVQFAGGNPAQGANNTPGDAGYGRGPRIPTDRNGNNVAFNYLLVALAPGYSLYSGSGNGDQLTVFDSFLAYAPVATLTNLGTGYRGATYTTLRHTGTTGRTETGENLVHVTRDAGSGTHNAWYNSYCIDPSHGVGEAIGNISTAAAEQLLGPSFIPGNSGGSSQMEAKVRNHRLAFGYSGAERGINSGWLDGNRIEVLAVRNDIAGGTAYARPTILNVLGFTSVDTTFPYTVPPVPLTNRYNGYNVGGPGVLATLGDPESSLNTVTINGVTETALGTDPMNMRAPMRNGYAAEYINNVNRSTDAFALDPSTPSNRFTPGEFLAQTLIIAGSRNVVQDRSTPCTLFVSGEPGYAALDTLNLGTAGFTAASNTLANARYTTFGGAVPSAGSFNGRTPDRFVFPAPAAMDVSDRYSDGIGYADPDGAGPLVATNFFRRQSGTTIAYQNTGLGNRNRVAGDFNGDGHRDVLDATEMLRAYQDRNSRDIDGLNPTMPWSAPAGTGLLTFSSDGSSFAGDQAIIEVLGDFNGDGNFGRIWNSGSNTFSEDKSDIRYWADGLASTPILADGIGSDLPYSGSGDARLANLDDSDNPYNPKNKKINRELGFTTIDTAWNTLTGDNNFFDTMLATGTYAPGDSRADIVATRTSLLTINFQPIGHNGVVDAEDIEYVRAQFLRNPNVTDGALNWSNFSEAQFAINSSNEIVGNFSADMNGDCVIDAADVTEIVENILDTDDCDVNLDGVVNSADEAIIVANQGTMNALRSQGDVNNDGMVNAADLAACFAPPVCCAGNASKTTDGTPAGDVNFADITSVLANFGTMGGGGAGPGDADCNDIVNFADITSVLANFGANCD